MIPIIACLQVAVLSSFHHVKWRLPSLLTMGLINKEIADRLNISVTTVITHRKNIMEKLHARSLADIIIYAVMNGYVNLGEL